MRTEDRSFRVGTTPHILEEGISEPAMWELTPEQGYFLGIA